MGGKSTKMVATEYSSTVCMYYIYIIGCSIFSVVTPCSGCLTLTVRVI